MSFSFGLGDTFVVSNGGLFVNFGGVNPPSATTVTGGVVVPPVIDNPFSGSEVSVSGGLNVSVGGSTDADISDEVRGNRGESSRRSEEATEADDLTNPQVLEVPISDREVSQVSIEPIFEDIIGNDGAGNPVIIGQQQVGTRFVQTQTSSSPAPTFQLPSNFLFNFLSKVFGAIEV
ncbi:MAG: hypothetical protein SWY16_12350 [Cyanobacteriota bacterium]|nr:hypothetical protein [Cyanobacteriota bacterium]